MRRERLDPEPLAVSTARNGHRPNGTFAPGNKAASGRRSRTEYMEALDEACSPSDLREIVARAVRDAKAGDPRAREWLGTYLLQRPPRLLDLTARVDDGPPDMSLAENQWLRAFE